ncbi:DNA/RNA helicase domain-containing protein [Methylobacterium sp. CM6257]
MACNALRTTISGIVFFLRIARMTFDRAQAESGNLLTQPPPTFAAQSGRSFYSATVPTFLDDDPHTIIGRLSSGHAKFHAAADAEQLRAWDREIHLLKEALQLISQTTVNWTVMIECPLLRLGKRLDTVILAPGTVIIIEFKTGRQLSNSSGRTQVGRYAQLLRDFHEVSQQQRIVPVLCVENAKHTPIKLQIKDGVSNLIAVNGRSLAALLELIANDLDIIEPPIDALTFDLSPYRPTPTIVQAAQSLYAGHQITEISRGDAADLELLAAAASLREEAAVAEKLQQHVICFVTGAPGAGKTLLGLDLALKSRQATHPAAFLSGNRPLVHVLTEALADDKAERTQTPKSDARYEAEAAIQNLLGYLKEHTDGATPPENIIIFDEAQRAWDEMVGQKLMGRPTSEPKLFLDILSRLDWACLVCLVGAGQEINRGEGGLPLWGKALASSASAGRRWRVVAAPQALEGGPDVAGAGLLDGAKLEPPSLRSQPQFHLSNSMRTYRNPLHGQWVAALLTGNLVKAKELAHQMAEPPARITRDLSNAKNWLRHRRIDGRSVGILASSGAVRLIGEGLPPAPHSKELNAIGHWFLRPTSDFRSSNALELPMSEFGCQGLELDYAALVWGGDLIWSEGKWTPRTMLSPKWKVMRQGERQRFRLNGYRVLLTRARAGLIICVPPGSADDPTRLPAEADLIAAALIEAGCATISEGN